MLRVDERDGFGNAVSFVVVEGNDAPAVVAADNHVATESAQIASDIPPAAEDTATPVASNIFVRIWNGLFGSNDDEPVDVNAVAIERADDIVVITTSPAASGWACCGSNLSSTANPNDADDIRSDSISEIEQPISALDNIAAAPVVEGDNNVDVQSLIDVIVNAKENQISADDTAISTFIFNSDHASLSADLALNSSNYGKIITTAHTPTIVGQIGDVVVNNKVQCASGFEGGATIFTQLSADDTAISTFIFNSDHASLSADLALNSSNYGKIITTAHTPTIVGQIGDVVVNNTAAAPVVEGDNNIDVGSLIDATVTGDLQVVDVAMIGESSIA